MPKQAPICRDCFNRIVDTLRNLTDSAEGVVNSWEGSRLANAVNALDGDAHTARALLDQIEEMAE